jgi:hypothetical protein
MLEKINPYKLLRGSSTSARCSESFAKQRTLALLGSYRQGEAADPHVYVAAVAAVLMHYDEEVVRSITDPMRGLPGKLKWLPTIAEVRAACEECLRPAREAMAREKREADTRLLLTPPTASPEERERAVERWARDMRPAMQPASVTRKPERSLEEMLADPLPPLGEYARMTKAERAAKILGGVSVNAEATQ